MISVGCHPERSEGAEALQRHDLLGFTREYGPFAALRVTPRHFIAGLILLSACASPEAHRTRGDGPGADVRNWRKPVELHAGAQPYHKTPCVTDPVECHGPPPVFGPTPPPD
jgi:hypothetical protein